jgi:AmmeMemoRadiSam system protein B
MEFNQRTLDFIGGSSASKLLEDNLHDVLNPFAIISPHAGYIFSGDVAATVFNTIDSNKKYNHVFILSTSHTANYRGASVLLDQTYWLGPKAGHPYNFLSTISWQTDEGTAFINNKDVFMLNNEFFNNDHTIEVLLPFIKSKINHNRIIPIMIGDPNLDNIYKISQILKPFVKNDNLFIISSDFSHYPNYEDAIELDNGTMNLIKSKNSQEFINGIFNINKSNTVTRMCGWSSCLTLLYMIEKEIDFDVKIVKYKNSGDTSYAGKDSVVGYFGIAFCKK